MKKTLIKVVSATLTLTLALASSAMAFAPAVEEEVKEVPVIEETAVAEVAAEEKVVAVAPVKAVQFDKEDEANAPDDSEVTDDLEAPDEGGSYIPEVEVPEVPEADNIEVITEGDVVITLNKTTKEVVITGEGAIPEDFYKYFMSKDTLAAVIEEKLEAYYNTEVELVYEGSDDAIEFLANNEYIDVATGERLFVTEEMLAEIDFSEFLDFSPEELVIGEGITEIPSYAFVFWSDLWEVTLPSTIEHIGEAAFAYCTGLETIIIPESVQSIYLGTFDGCVNLETITLPGYENTSEAAFYGTNANVMVAMSNGDEGYRCNFIA